MNCCIMHDPPIRSEIGRGGGQTLMQKFSPSQDGELHFRTYLKSSFHGNVYTPSLTQLKRCAVGPSNYVNEQMDGCWV